MPRVSDAEVKQLVTEMEGDASLFIEQASSFIDDHLLDKGLSANALKYVELYLAAHFALMVVEKGGVIRVKTGDSFESYGVKPGEGFLSTRFGQMAAVYDTSGTITAFGKIANKAEFRVV